MAIKESWKEYIKETVQKEKEDSCGFRSNILGAIGCWDFDGFANKQEAEIAYRTFVKACQIRTYCRRNKITTRKGTSYFTNAKQDPKIWRFVQGTDMNSEAGGVRWSWRKVDEIKNIYIWFV